MRLGLIKSELDKLGILDEVADWQAEAWVNRRCSDMFHEVERVRVLTVTEPSAILLKRYQDHPDSNGLDVDSRLPGGQNPVQHV